MKDEAPNMNEDLKQAWMDAGAGPLLAVRLAALEADTTSRRRERSDRIAERHTLSRITELAHALADTSNAYTRCAENADHFSAGNAMTHALQSLAIQLHHAVNAMDGVK